MLPRQPPLGLPHARGPSRRGRHLLFTLARLFGLASAEPRRPAPRRRPRDHQRSRLYRWEQEHVLPLADRRLTLAQCRELVAEVFTAAERPDGAAGWAPPRVTDGRGRRHACGSRQVIKLPRWSRTTAVVLHECAHGLAADMHGPAFAAVYIDLLVRFAGLDPDQLRRTAALAGVDVGTATRRLRRNLAATSDASDVATLGL